METTKCKWCGKTRMPGTKMCDECWELFSRIEADLELAKRMIATIEGERKMEYTPGPWILDDLGDKWAIITDIKNPFWIATVYSGYDGDEENANLIAAAPNLLEACEKMESFINNLPDGGDYELVEEAQQAIKRAKGE